MILAGGSSRRMGRDKLGMTVGGIQLIRRVQDALELRCEEVLVVANAELPAGYDLAARVVPDLRPGRRGPLAGLEAGLMAARNDRVFVAAGDMPFISGGLAAFLLELVSDRDVRAAVPRYGGRLHPLCAAYKRELLPEVSFALNIGVGAVHEVLENAAGVRYIEEELTLYGDPATFLMNVNSPEDLLKARELCEG